MSKEIEEKIRAMAIEMFPSDSESQREEFVSIAMKRYQEEKAKLESE